MIFHPDGQKVASASFDKTIKIWDIKAGKQVLSITGHTAPVNAIAFSPDGKLIASGSQIKL